MPYYADFPIILPTGEELIFEQWSIGSRFEPCAAIYVVTKKSCLDQNSRQVLREAIDIDEKNDLQRALTDRTVLHGYMQHGTDIVVLIYKEEDAARRTKIKEELQRLKGMAG